MVDVPKCGGPAAWKGPVIGTNSDWKLELGSNEIAELLAAVTSSESRRVAPAEITIADFPLPRLGPRLDGVLDELLEGRGFVLLRGIPVQSMSERQCDIALWGIGAHLGIPIPQNSAGDLIVHVRDEGRDYSDPHVRGYETSAALEYHSDSADLVGLMCLRPARRGGESTIVSAVTVHDELVDSRPDLAALLHEPWWHDRRSGDGPESFFTCPLWAWQGRRLYAHYGRAYIESAERGEGVPALRAEQIEALDAVDRLTRSEELALNMQFRPGDLQFLNNYTVFHARTGYEDWPDSARRRDLGRLWLVVRRPLDLPPDFVEGGIVPRSVAFG